MIGGASRAVADGPVLRSTRSDVPSGDQTGQPSNQAPRRVPHDPIGADLLAAGVDCHDMHPELELVRLGLRVGDLAAIGRPRRIGQQAVCGKHRP